MNRKHAVIAAAALLALALPARSEVKYGGYLSFEYIKGQAESSHPRGNMENLLVGFLAAGQVGQKFGFAVEARTLSVSSFDLAQAWAGYLPAEAFTIKVGLFLVPFGTWNRASRPHETALIRTPLNLEYLYPASWRDLGILVEGQVGVAAPFADVLHMPVALAVERMHQGVVLAIEWSDRFPEALPADHLELGLTRVVWIGTAQDVAHAVWFLASRYADYITGQVLHVNGGFGLSP